MDLIFDRAEPPTHTDLSCFAIRLLRFPSLYRNAIKTRQRAGSILVEASGLDGKPLPGRSFDDAVPIIGDQHRTLVTWKNADTHGVETGKPIMLRFRMEKAKLYGLDFE